MWSHNTYSHIIKYSSWCISHYHQWTHAAFSYNSSTEKTLGSTYTWVNTVNSNIRCTKISKLKCFSSHLVVVFTQFVEARCLVENEDVIGAAPTGDAPTTSEWSTIQLPTNVPLILETWRCSFTKDKSSENLYGAHISNFITTLGWISFASSLYCNFVFICVSILISDLMIIFTEFV